MFRERKAAQIATWFLVQSGNGAMETLKLMKLMYLADREAMREHGFTMTGDRFVSMPHGPVLSQTYDHVQGGLTSGSDGWDSWIADRAGRLVSLEERASRDLDELSPADERILENIWDQFGSMTAWELREYTHIHCPEWEDPNGSSRPIPYVRVFKVLGLSPEAAKDAASRIAEQDRIDRLFVTA
jgi:uncharacterized phage-associated protein